MTSISQGKSSSRMANTKEGNYLVVYTIYKVTHANILTAMASTIKQEQIVITLIASYIAKIRLLMWTLGYFSLQVSLGNFSFFPLSLPYIHFDRMYGHITKNFSFYLGWIKSQGQPSRQRSCKFVLTFHLRVQTRA